MTLHHAALPGGDDGVVVVTQAYPILNMDDIDPAQHATRWWSRGVMLLLLAGLMLLTRIAWKRREARGEEV